jgi:ribosomal protein S18 acetylase RimI-like enzyme
MSAAATPARRAVLRVALAARPAVDRPGLRAPRPDDAPALAALMLAAYAGTVDDAGGTEADAAEEIGRTFGGEYGEFLWPMARVVEVGGRIASACLVTRWQDRPFVAFSLTHPQAQRQGLARAALADAMRSLHADGETELRLVVTLANTPALALYQSLGFANEAPGALLRRATRADVPGIQRVRHAVKENRLITRRIGDDEVVHAIEASGRGWVVVDGGEVVAFAIGNGEDGNIWALFVDPGHEGRGHGRHLHDRMVEWLWGRGLERLWLSTDPKTRARRFYAQAGWQEVGPLPSGEVRLELPAPPRPD